MIEERAGGLMRRAYTALAFWYAAACCLPAGLAMMNDSARPATRTSTVRENASQRLLTDIEYALSRQIRALLTVWTVCADGRRRTLGGRHGRHSFSRREPGAMS
jgi:hypothetical protein